MSFHTETIYRPPSEANSLILRITRGCSHNKCTFCSMYKDRPFEVRPLEEILSQLQKAKDHDFKGQRVFLADGNALSLKASHLHTLFDALKKRLPQVSRITAYAAPQDILRHGLTDLVSLREKGLSMVYMGLESGSDLVLAAVHKGVTAAAMVEASDKLHQAGIQMSITVISGLGGRAHWHHHASETARVLSAMKPQYIGLLTLMLTPGTPLYGDWKNGTFEVLEPLEVLMETRAILENLDLDHSIFRSNHASNYLALKGTLPRDKDQLLKTLDLAIQRGQEALKPENLRGL